VKCEGDSIESETIDKTKRIKRMERGKEEEREKWWREKCDNR
jgi:hypothetical protein